MEKNMEKVTKREFNYFVDKINFGDSYLDAIAIDIMNRIDTLFRKEECNGCKHFYIGNDYFSHCKKGINDGTDNTNHQIASGNVVEEDFGCILWSPKDD